MPPVPTTATPPPAAPAVDPFAKFAIPEPHVATPAAGADPFAQFAVPEKDAGVLPALEAGALGAADFPTLGLAGHVLSGTGLVPAKRQEELKKAHPIATAVGGAAGLLAAQLIPGVGEAADVDAAAGAAEGGSALAAAARALPSNLITEFAKAEIPEAAEGAGAMARIGAGAARGALEGAMFAGGQAAGDVVANAAMGDPDHTSEHLLSHGGMNVLLGAALGGVLGGGISGLGVMADTVGAAATRAARAASATIAEQRGALAFDVLGATAATLKRLYGKGTAGLQAIKDASGASGEDFPEVLGNILSSPAAIARNPATGEMEPLITAGDTAETVNQKIQSLREEAGGGLRQLYELLDRTGPGISKQDVIDTIEARAQTFKGDPSAVDTRSALRRIAEALAERDGDFIRPSDAWQLRINNDADIWRKTTGAMRENVDAEHALRDTLNEALDSYAESAPRATVRDPLTGRFRALLPGESQQLSTVATDLKTAAGRYAVWGELGRIAKVGSETLAAKAPSLVDMANAASRGAYTGARGFGVVGLLAHGALGAAVGAPVGAVAGAATRIARTLIGPQMASRALEASRSLTEFLQDAAPKVNALVEDSVPKMVHAAFDAGRNALPEAAVADLDPLRSPWGLPAGATAADVLDLDKRLQGAQVNAGQLYSDLDQLHPGLAASVAVSGKGAAARLRKMLPLNPYGHGSWAPNARAIQRYNDYALGVVGGMGPVLSRVARGTATSAMISGARDTYPRMSARADDLLASHLRNNPGTDRAMHASIGLWFGSHDPFQRTITNAVQRAAFTSPPTGGPAPEAHGGRAGIAQSRLNKIGAPSRAETTTQGTSRRLGK